jgi:hypothetical protein
MCYNFLLESGNFSLENNCSRMAGHMQETKEGNNNGG